MTEALLIEVAWPAKQLSPNTGCHHMTRHRFKKAAKIEAGWATKAACPFDWGHDGRFDVHIRAYPPVQRNRDADNLIASLKAHLDGIADAIGVNDSLFNAPTVEWADITQHGKIVITLKPAEVAA